MSKSDKASTKAKSKKGHKKGRKAIQHTAIQVKKRRRWAGPVLAALAAGLAAVTLSLRLRANSRAWR